MRDWSRAPAVDIHATRLLQSASDAGELDRGASWFWSFWPIIISLDAVLLSFDFFITFFLPFSPPVFVYSKLLLPFHFSIPLLVHLTRRISRILWAGIFAILIRATPRPAHKENIEKKRKEKKNQEINKQIKRKGDPLLHCILLQLVLFHSIHHFDSILLAKIRNGYWQTLAGLVIVSSLRRTTLFLVCARRHIDPSICQATSSDVLQSGPTYRLVLPSVAVS